MSIIIGKKTNGISTADATAITTDILNGKTAYARSQKIIGNLIPKTGNLIIQTATFTGLSGNLLNLDFSPTLFYFISSSNFKLYSDVSSSTLEGAYIPYSIGHGDYPTICHRVIEGSLSPSATTHGGTNARDVYMSDLANIPFDITANGNKFNVYFDFTNTNLGLFDGITPIVPTNFNPTIIMAGA